MFLISAMAILVIVQDKAFDHALTPSEIRAERYHYWNKRVKICGDAIGNNGPFSLLVSQKGPDTHAVSIDPKLDVKRIKGRFCVKGIIKRRDGLTLKQAQKRGRSYVIVDTEFDPQFIVRP